MKKKIRLLKPVAAVLLFCFLCSGYKIHAEGHDKGKIMTSFYPIHIFAMNVFKDIPDLEVDCMTASDTGCLHDYQLLVGDMMKLSEADALIVCGAGMESYLPDIVRQYPDLVIIDCSRGIDLLMESENDEDFISYNAHTWLDVTNAVQIVKTIAETAKDLYPQDEIKILDNAEKYTECLSELDKNIRNQLEPVKGNKIVTFHDSFPYFANAYGLEIAATINEEHEEALSPSRLDDVVKAVLAAGSPPLFVEPQYSNAAAYAIAAETGSEIYILDPLTTGKLEYSAYENGMMYNVESLLKAFIDK